MAFMITQILVVVLEVGYKLIHPQTITKLEIFEYLFSIVFDMIKTNNKAYRILK